MIVLDASIVVSWYFESERTPAKLTIMDRAIADGAVVPAHWLTEVANALQMGVRRCRFDGSRLQESLNALAELAISRESSAFASAVAAVLLSSRHDLTVYAAAYLELAMRQRLPLATLDKDLAAAAGGCRGAALAAGASPSLSAALSPRERRETYERSELVAAERGCSFN